MHKSIVEALEKKDGDAASKLLTEHIRFSSEISVEIDEESNDLGEQTSLSGLDLPNFLREELLTTPII